MDIPKKVMLRIRDFCSTGNFQEIQSLIDYSYTQYNDPQLDRLIQLLVFEIAQLGKGLNIKNTHLNQLHKEHALIAEVLTEELKNKDPSIVELAFDEIQDEENKRSEKKEEISSNPGRPVEIVLHD